MVCGDGLYGEGAVGCEGMVGAFCGGGEGGWVGGEEGFLGLVVREVGGIFGIGGGLIDCVYMPLMLGPRQNEPNAVMLMSLFASNSR